MKKFILIFVIIFIIFSLNINASSDNNSSPNDNISIPNLFYSGSVISSSQINRNFEYLLQLIKFNIILLTLDNVTIGYARESLYNTGSETTYEVLINGTDNVIRFTSYGSGNLALDYNSQVNFMTDNMKNISEDCSEYIGTYGYVDNNNFCLRQYQQRYFSNSSCMQTDNNYLYTIASYNGEIRTRVNSNDEEFYEASNELLESYYQVDQTRIETIMYSNYWCDQGRTERCKPEEGTTERVNAEYSCPNVDFSGTSYSCTVYKYSNSCNYIDVNNDGYSSDIRIYTKINLNTEIDVSKFFDSTSNLQIEYLTN